MKRRFLSALALAAFLPALALAGPRLDGGDMAVPRNLLAAGGGLSTGAGMTLDASIGETAISSFTVSAAAPYAGLMHELAQPGSVTSIVSVTKDTGSLELSWAAPGLDGLEGPVVSGYWRIDSSSDPAHVFSPTTFVTELGTTVAPGAVQSYALTGLLPNTTYFTRIYLADARKYFAETSAPSGESTLARVPPAPYFSGVFPTSVTISWTIPSGAAEGYVVNGSSTDFGALAPGGVVSTSQTSAGLSVTLTLAGLNPNTSYYFKLGSLNWQSDVNFTTIMSTLTRPGGPLAIYNLTLAADNLKRLVTLSWSNPAFANPAGVTVLVSTNPISASLAAGTPYPLGTVLPDGSVVRSSAPAASFAETGLSLDVTGYFALYSRDTLNVYSVAVSTFLVLDIPPMAPAGLSGALSADGSAISLTWSHVASNLDGTSFKNPFVPQPFELNRYDIYRSTGISFPNWVWVGSAPWSSSAFIAGVPVPGNSYFYKVAAGDGYQSSWQDSSMVADTSGGLYVVASDRITRLHIPADMAAALLPSGNSSGRPLLIRANERPQDLGGPVMKSISFDVVVSPGNEPALLPPASGEGLSLALRYETLGGQVVPSAAGAPVAARSATALGVSAGNARNALMAYYVDGDKAAKIFGQVDPVTQTVNVKAPWTGTYQIRTVAASASFSFDLSGVSNKVITPN